jgi:hypothetical protein
MISFFNIRSIFCLFILFKHLLQSLQVILNVIAHFLSAPTMFSWDIVLYTVLALVGAAHSRVIDPCHHEHVVGHGGRANWLTGCPPTGATTAQAKAIYFMTNQATNSVIAIPVSANGTLSGGTSIGTRGAGSNLIDTATNEPAAPDALASQGSVKVEGNVSFQPFSDVTPANTSGCSFCSL